ncbi:MAG: hypothetical protein ABI824_07285 [Acidobacteriota bacterium]
MGRRPGVQLNANNVVVKPEVAALQIAKDSAPTKAAETVVSTDNNGAASAVSAGIANADQGAVGGSKQLKAHVLRRFHGSVKVNATRLSRDVDAIASSVVQHLAGLLDAKVTITLEIEAEIPNGTPDNVIRTVTENSRTLKFDTSGFEER